VRADASLRDQRLSEDVEGAAYFTVAEALANTLKHAHAEHVAVSLARQNGSLVVEVADDGCGMERTEGSLTTITERVAAVGGDLTVSSEPGRGTTVRSRLRVDGGAR
jgi:signal transduction histidine kinase